MFTDELAAADAAVEMSARRQKNQAAFERFRRSRERLRQRQQHREPGGVLHRGSERGVVVAGEQNVFVGAAGQDAHDIVGIDCATLPRAGEVERLAAGRGGTNGLGVFAADPSGRCFFKESVVRHVQFAAVDRHLAQQPDEAARAALPRLIVGAEVGDQPVGAVQRAVRNGVAGIVDKHRAALEVRRVEFAKLHVGNHDFAGDIRRVERLVAANSNVNRPASSALGCRPGGVWHGEAGNVRRRIADGQAGHRGSPIIHRNRLEARITQANFVEALKHELLGFESLFVAGTADAERDDAPDLSEHACRREGQLFFPCYSLRSGR